MQPAIEPDKRAPLRTEEVQEKLRLAIIHGELRPNERLIEVDLAERFNVSRTPIRESVQKLAADGLITRHHRRGWIVHEHTREEIREIYEVRKGLESWATRLATERATPDQLAAIEEVHRQASALSAAELRPVLVELTEGFHDAVLSACGNERLQRLVKRSTEYYFNNALARVYTDDEIIESIRDQAKILDAIRAKDADEAERLARTHIDEALHIVLARQPL